MNEYEKSLTRQFKALYRAHLETEQVLRAKYEQLNLLDQVNTGLKSTKLDKIGSGSAPPITNDMKLAKYVTRRQELTDLITKLEEDVVRVNTILSKLDPSIADIIRKVYTGSATYDHLAYQYHWSEAYLRRRVDREIAEAMKCYYRD